MLQYFSIVKLNSFSAIIAKINRSKIYAIAIGIAAISLLIQINYLMNGRQILQITYFNM